MRRLIIFDWGRTLYDPETEKLFQDTTEVLEFLSQKYTLAIVALATAGEGEIKKRLSYIKNNDLEKYFSSILFDVSDKGGLYKRTLEILSTPPHETIIVDDRVKRGIAWGNKNGTKTIWFQNGKFKDELPDKNSGIPTKTIHTLLEIKNIELE